MSNSINLIRQAERAKQSAESNVKKPPRQMLRDGLKFPTQKPTLDKVISPSGIEKVDKWSSGIQIEDDSGSDFEESKQEHLKKLKILKGPRGNKTSFNNNSMHIVKEDSSPLMDQQDLFLDNDKPISPGESCTH